MARERSRLAGKSKLGLLVRPHELRRVAARGEFAPSDAGHRGGRLPQNQPRASLPLAPPPVDSLEKAVEITPQG